ncbi:hypothetical protein RFM26_24490 [Mesorhizobium sp. VK23B]|uniref:DUF6894 domain-containing protein n=1 Tax=Mesorhizobium dulcispinae TaxID=3072316 RepID=A0ABU4XNE4_9HYPH|nr:MULTISPECIES: hypothetical protein [unclassified Mesorhizobium]MDX8468871.1 hypothetical protein [Mesorhizobium sp. VK23B]MDX8475340.1 hypothetical protein [Mesorhizobium sp. VK23A]MDX8520858.1 hypothetical protein [Mesorhizobium sp. VK23D]
MERFYFDLYNTEQTQLDAEGQLLSNPERAGMEALRILHDVAWDEMQGGECLTTTVKVRNEKSEQVFEASLTLNAVWAEDRKRQPRELSSGLQQRSLTSAVPMPEGKTCSKGLKAPRSTRTGHGYSSGRPAAARGCSCCMASPKRI